MFDQAEAASERKADGSTFQAMKTPLYGFSLRKSRDFPTGRRNACTKSAGHIILHEGGGSYFGVTLRGLLHIMFHKSLYAVLFVFEKA
jgi:hypothetical protein